MNESPKNEGENQPEIEMDKPIEAKELFESLVNLGSERWADRQEFEQELERAGVEKENIDLAIKFIACLSVVNGLVFRDKTELVFSTSKEKSGNFVQYTPEKEGQGENYWINVDYFGETIKGILEEDRRVFLDENNQLIKNKEDAPVVSSEELLLGIAIHEVRHRLQEKKKIRIIHPSDKVVCDGKYIDDDFIELQNAFLKRMSKKGVKSKQEEKLLERQTGPRELDAVIIEKIAVSRLHHKKTSLEQLKQLAIIEPEK